MRLINCETLEIHKFLENKRPSYAILSHTWGSEEVSFQEFLEGRGRSKAGYDKVLKCCQLALKHNFDWVWVDTVCIDKTSSAELSESINSMFRWYQQADICFAYLSDVPERGGFEAQGSHFRESRWFKRGWTLQEMLAPEVLWFFSRQWTNIGDRTEPVMLKTITEITGIDDDALTQVRPLSTYSIAQRMSWGSMRETTRIEDVAYSLLGIFDVNIPLLYGEGKKAFLRLQEEIMRGSQDQSLFAWDAVDNQHHIESCLAESPANFKNSGDIVVYRRHDATEQYSMTNRGLKIKLPLCNFQDDREKATAILCCHRTSDLGCPLGITLVRHGVEDQFSRFGGDNPHLMPFDRICNAVERDIYIGQRNASHNHPLEWHGWKFIIKRSSTYQVLESFPPQFWKETHRTLQCDREGGNAVGKWHAAFLCTSKFKLSPFIVSLGYRSHGTWCCIYDSDADQPLEHMWHRFGNSLGSKQKWNMTSFNIKKGKHSVKFDDGTVSLLVTVTTEECKVMGEPSYVTDIHVKKIRKQGLKRVKQQLFDL